MVVTVDQIQQGVVNNDDILTQEIEKLNEAFNIATDEAELTEGTISQSVEEALEQMITASDNYSALLLSEKIRLSNVTSFLQENGFTESTIGDIDGYPKSTAYDIALFFEKLYAGELATKENTQQMLELLKNQQLNNKLPKHLPEEVIIAHKTGELDAVSHDAGIVFTQKGDYIIVVMSETEDRYVAVERIALISKEVYDYFSSN
jgi:beta-lactamase class A